VDAADFVVVVDAATLAEADAAFDAWCRESGTDRAALGDDVRIDTGRGADGDWRRYLVRRARLDSA
jgi:hypothetical protein